MNRSSRSLVFLAVITGCCILLITSYAILFNREIAGEPILRTEYHAASDIATNTGKFDKVGAEDVSSPESVEDSDSSNKEILREFRRFADSIASLDPHKKALRWESFLRDYRRSGELVEKIKDIYSSGRDFEDFCKSVPVLNGRHLWSQLIYAVVPQPGSSGFVEYERFRETLPPGDFAGALDQAVIARKLGADLKNAVVGLRGISDRRLREAVEPDVLRNLVLRDRSSALHYFLSDDCLSYADSQVLTDVVINYVKYEPGEASSIIRDAVSSARRDTAILGMVKVIAKSDTEAAMQWIEQISSEDIKKSAFQSMPR